MKKAQQRRAREYIKIQLHFERLKCVSVGHGCSRGRRHHYEVVGQSLGVTDCASVCCPFIAPTGLLIGSLPDRV